MLKPNLSDIQEFQDIQIIHREIGSLIREKRIELGLNAIEMAAQLNYDPSLISKIEKGKNISINFIDKFLQKFDVNKDTKVKLLRYKEILEKKRLANIQNDSGGQTLKNILHTISPIDERFTAKRYRVGKVQADVYMDLLGGGDQYFDRHNLNFVYEPGNIKLPDEIEKERASQIKEMEESAKRNGQVFFNGPAIRLNSFDLNVVQSQNGKEEKKPILHFGPTCWHDFALSNRRMDQKITGYTKTIREMFADENSLVSRRNVDEIKLSNILTVSIVMLTNDNYTLLGRRTERVDNSGGIFAASAAENIHRWKDEPSDPNDPWSLPKEISEEDSETGSNVTWDYIPATCPNPFFTVLRGIREEISEEVAQAVTVDDIKFLSLAWNITNFQPHLYAFLKADMKINEIEGILSASRGDDNWEANLIPVFFAPTAQLKDYLVNRKWAEVSKGAVLRSLIHVYGYQEVNKALS